MKDNLKPKQVSISEALSELNKLNEENDYEIVSSSPSAVASNNPDDINQKILSKLISISKAVGDEFNVDPKLIFDDMVSDLRIINGDKLISELDPSKPLDAATIPMAELAQMAGLDSNMALHALLEMDEQECVNMIKMARGPVQQLGSGRTSLNQIGNRSKKADKFIELNVDDAEELDEDLATIYSNYYKDIPRPVFDNILQIDPTYNKEKDKMGIYGKWLLNLYKKGEDLKDTQEINHQLNMFNDMKNRLPVNERDVGRFKSIRDFFQFVNSTDVVDKSLFQVQAEAVQGVTVLGTTAEWEVYTPETYEASRFLRGDNAVWCTGRHDSSGESYYRQYNQNGNFLVIFINKNNPDEKYQGSFEVGSKYCREFRDARNDTPKFTLTQFLLKTNLDRVLKNTKLKDFKELIKAEELRKYNEGNPYVYNNQIETDQDLKYAVKNVTFSSEVISIRPFAFKDFTSLVSIEIPNSITSLGEGAFFNCTSLTNVKLPDTLEAIPSATFKKCTNLKEIFLPDSVKKIHVYAFYGCDNVTITLKKRPIEISSIDAEFLKAHIKRIQ